MTPAIPPLSASDIVDELEVPRTPAEAMRHWMIERLWFGSLFSFVSLVVLIGIVWLGDWSPVVEKRRLDILGLVAILTLVRLYIVDWSFSIGGPVGRWVARWGNRSVEATDDEQKADRAYDGAAV